MHSIVDVPNFLKERQQRRLEEIKAAEAAEGKAEGEEDGDEDESETAKVEEPDPANNKQSEGFSDKNTASRERGQSLAAVDDDSATSQSATLSSGLLGSPQHGPLDGYNAISDDWEVLDRSEAAARDRSHTSVLIDVNLLLSRTCGTGHQHLASH